jgi:phospholipid/cholesterol/gamma-HCH transport system substrate-binding protein
MQTRAPSAGRILLATGFALACFGLLLFLWIAFGGSVPLGAEGYRLMVPFKEATQLAPQSDVRISGVSVGKVTSIELGDNAEADATLEIDSRFAPVPENTRAILRQKTLLGETYVELTPGDPAGGMLPEGATLPAAQVSNAVQLDEILRTFDQPTREAFQSWMQNVAVALRGRGPDLSLAFAALDPFAQQANQLLTVLDTQREAVRQLVSGGADIFEALSQRQGQLRSLIENTQAVFSTTAARNSDLQALFRALPTFLDESRLTVERLQRFALSTDPLVQQLRPAAQQLPVTLSATDQLLPKLDGFFAGLKRAIPAGVAGLPALRELLGNDLPPLLGGVGPALSDLTPILQSAHSYEHEITAFLGNVAAATNAAGPAPGGTTLNYLRTTSPLGPGSLAAYPNRLSVDRTNPYVKPGGYSRIGDGGLQSFETRQCSSGLSLALTDSPPLIDPDLFERLKLYAFDAQTQSSQIPAPPCVQQGPYKPIGGNGSSAATRYLHVLAAPGG